MTQEERDIKKYLLPYQCHLKMTDISNFKDTAPLIPDPQQPKEYGWRELEYECEYDGYNII